MGWKIKIWGVGIVVFTLGILGEVSVKDAGISEVLPGKVASSPKGSGAESMLPKPKVESIGVSGTRRLSISTLRRDFGKEIDQWMRLGTEGKVDQTTASEKILLEKIRRKYGFFRASFSVVQFLQYDKIALHITLDVVELKDANRRAPFRESPQKTVQGVDGLLEQWNQYERTALDVVDKGEKLEEDKKCISLYCPFGHADSRLKKYESIFLEQVQNNYLVLKEVFLQDSNPDRRISALFLLQYLKDREKLISLMLEGMKDSNSTVRSNVLRSFDAITEFRKEIVLPWKPFAEAIQYENVSDRTGAMTVLLGLVLNTESIRSEVASMVSETLIDFLDSTQPDEKEIALALLKKVSGQSFAANQKAEWAKWAQRHQSSHREVSGK